MTIPFIDAHAHLWSLNGVIRYPWLTPPFSSGSSGSVEPIAHDYLLADYLRDAQRWNLKGMVHVDAAAHPEDALAETVWLEEAAATSGLPSAIVAFVPLDDPAVGALLAAQAQHTHVRGVRHTVNWHADAARSFTPRDVTHSEQWQSGFAKIGSHGLSFDLQCYPGQMPELAKLFERHPETPVIIDHLGMPIPSDPDGIAQWNGGLRQLARLDHVFLKISGVGLIYPEWTTERIRPLVLQAIDLFGPERCMFASDFPVDKLFGSFDQHLEAYHTITARFSAEERASMFSENANRIYRLGIAL